MSTGRESRAPERLAAERIFQGRVFAVSRERVRLPSGLEQAVDVVEHPGAVAIVPRLSDGRWLLVRQYRHPAGAWLVELPAGRLEPGEAPLAAAQRELEEETGHRARTWQRLGAFWTAPGFCSERITLFVADGLETAPDSLHRPDADEEIELVPTDPRTLLTAQEGDAKTLLAAHWLAGARGPL